MELHFGIRHIFCDQIHSLGQSHDPKLSGSDQILVSGSDKAIRTGQRRSNVGVEGTFRTFLNVLGGIGDFIVTELHFQLLGLPVRIELLAE